MLIFCDFSELREGSLIGLRLRAKRVFVTINALINALILTREICAGIRVYETTQLLA